MSELDKVIEEKVVEEMEKTRVHPKQLEEGVERLTDAIRQEMKNVNTDKELDAIEDHLDEIEEMVNGQKDFYEDSRSEEQARMHGSGKATPGGLTRHTNSRSSHQPVDSGKLKSRMEDLTEKYNQNNNE